MCLLAFSYELSFKPPTKGVFSCKAPNQKPEFFKLMPEIRPKTMPENKPKSAMEQFLSDIPVANQQEGKDVFEQSLTGTTEEVVAPETTETTETADEPRKNRQHRRLEQKLQAEREANIALTERVKTLSEVQKFAQATEGTVDADLIRLYGDTEAGRAAAKLTQGLLEKNKTQAREEALELFQKQQAEANKEVESNKQELETMLEDIEDEFNVDITSDTPASRKARQGFYSLLEKMSPKDKEGQVVDFADPIAVWEMYQLQNKPDNNRAKDLSARTMVRSGASVDTKLEATAQERFLKDAGII